MPVGNDIVDLREPGTQPGSRHPRFDIRVFTDDEREELAAASLAERVRWSLWAAKESAFKAARQLHPEVRFIPRRFAVELLDESRAEVVHEIAGRFRIWIEHAQEWIHAVATPADEGSLRPPAEAEVGFLDVDDPTACPSEQVRTLARKAVAGVLSTDPGDLRILKRCGIPRLGRGERILPWTLSLSHHGRLVACAWRGRGG